MKKWLLGLSTTILASAALAQESKTERFSWGAGEFVRRGYQNAPWIRDPFFPHTSRFQLGAIIAPDLAYINRRWVRVGDELEGFKVQRIAEKEVELAKRREIVVLKIRE